jgi:ribonuclease BN (tRNA processing enzyme)
VRAEHDGAVVTISGDTTECDEVVALARDADLLLMDACAPASDHPLAGFHATPADAGSVAARARAARLILTHLLPQADPEHVAGQACGRFAGLVEVARDLNAHDVP